MKLKEKINADFITAMKAKDEVAKSALSNIKAKITEGEKAKGRAVADDDDILKIIVKAVKQREESQAIYEKAGRTELAHVEASEAAVLRNYLPQQMSDEEIELALKEIIQDMSVVTTNPQALAGKSMGEFTKKYNGRADMANVKLIISKILG
jgi:uncharacterized protein YqeY